MKRIADETGENEKMINLSVEEKCQDCPNFSPTVNSIETTCFGDKLPTFIHTVMCDNKDFCDTIERRLEKFHGKVG